MLFGVGGILFLAYVSPGFSRPHDDIHVLYGATTGAFTLLVLLLGRHFDLYGFSAIAFPQRRIMRISGCCALAFVVLMALAFAIKISETYSRVWFFGIFLVGTGAIVAARLAFGAALFELARSGRITRRIAIVGGGVQCLRLLDRLEETAHPWNRVVGVFDDRATRRLPEVERWGFRGSTDDLVEYCRKNRLDDIIITLPWSAETRILEIVSKLRQLPVHVHLGFDLVGFALPGRAYTSFDDFPVLDVAPNPFAGWRFVVKSAFDRTMAALLILAFSPVLAAVAVLIRLDSKGPILFRQPRYGFNNETFLVYKFRSMYHGPRQETVVKQATRGDPRVTRIGRFLRRSSLDELPQLFNVLEGTMSLVGPRPHAVAHNEEYAKLIEGYYARHRVKPGITGWAQVNGLRGETDTNEKMAARVRHDIFYIENWSLFFDIQILFRTLLVGFIHRNAY